LGGDGRERRGRGDEGRREGKGSGPLAPKPKTENSAHA